MLVSIGRVSLLDWFVVGLSRLLCQAGCLTGQRQGPALKWRSKLSISSSTTLARISSLVMRQMQKRLLTQVFSQKSVALKLEQTHKAQESFWCWCCSYARHVFFSQCQSDLWRCDVWLFGFCSRWGATSRRWSIACVTAVLVAIASCWVQVPLSWEKPLPGRFHMSLDFLL